MNHPARLAGRLTVSQDLLGGATKKLKKGWGPEGCHTTAKVGPRVGPRKVGPRKFATMHENLPSSPSHPLLPRPRLPPAPPRSKFCGSLVDAVVPFPTFLCVRSRQRLSSDVMRPSPLCSVRPQKGVPQSNTFIHQQGLTVPGHLTSPCRDPQCVMDPELHDAETRPHLCCTARGTAPWRSPKCARTSVGFALCLWTRSCDLFFFFRPLVDWAGLVMGSSSLVWLTQTTFCFSQRLWVKLTGMFDDFCESFGRADLELGTGTNTFGLLNGA